MSGRVGAFARAVSFDKYGIGLSDPIPSQAVPPLEEWVDDVRTVMDAVEIERAAIFGDRLPATVGRSSIPRQLSLCHLDGAARAVAFAVAREE